MNQKPRIPEALNRHSALACEGEPLREIVEMDATYIDIPRIEQCTPAAHTTTTAS